MGVNWKRWKNVSFSAMILRQGWNHPLNQPPPLYIVLLHFLQQCMMAFFIQHSDTCLKGDMTWSLNYLKGDKDLIQNTVHPWSIFPTPVTTGGHNASFTTNRIITCVYEFYIHWKGWNPHLLVSKVKHKVLLRKQLQGLIKLYLQRQIHVDFYTWIILLLN